MVTDLTLPQSWDIRRLRIATEAAGVALWSWDTATDDLSLDERAFDLWGLPRQGNVSFADLSALVEPEDLAGFRAAFTLMRDVVGSHEADFRILYEDGVRWISVRGRGEGDGKGEGNDQDRLMCGVFLDVTERKLAEEAHELLVKETNHRVKNVFAIAAALTGISARAAATPEGMAEDLRRRLMSLSRAHELIQTTLDVSKKTAPLGDLFPLLLSVYDTRGVLGDRIRVAVPQVYVGETSITSLSLIIHELATNSLKYGALSRDQGLLEITGTADEHEVVLTWRETGGPPVAPPQGKGGFGSQLIHSSVTRRIGGAVEFAWPVSGVVVTLRLNKAKLEA